MTMLRERVEAYYAGAAMVPRERSRTPLPGTGEECVRTSLTSCDNLQITWNDIARVLDHSCTTCTEPQMRSGY